MVADNDFDPDEYLAEKGVDFDANAYLAEKGISMIPSDRLDQIPGLGGQSIDYPQSRPQPTTQESVAAVFDVAGTLLSGIPSGLGYMKGAIEGFFRRFLQEGFSEQDAYQLAMQEAAKYAREPQSELGKDIMREISAVTDVIPPIMGGNVGKPMGLKQGVQGAIDMADTAYIPQSKAKQAIGRQLAGGQTYSEVAGYQLKDPKLREAGWESSAEQRIQGIDDPNYKVEISPQGSDRLLNAPPLQSASNAIPEPELTPQQARIIKLPESQKLIKMGLRKPFVAAVQQYTKDESRLARKMAQIKKAAMDNDNVVVQPLRVVGDAVKDQVGILTKAKNDAAKKIQLSLREMEGKELNYGGVLIGWRENLESKGIDINQRFNPETGEIQWSVDLRRSKFAGDKGADRLLNLITDRLSLIANERGSLDKATAKDLHDLKKLIDYRVEWGRKPSDESLTPQAENLAKSLRGGINDVLRQGSKNYEAANDDYAAAIRPLAQLNETTNSKIDFLDDDLSPQKIGQEMRKTVGNWVTTEDLRVATKALSIEAKNRGYDKNINLDRLITLNSSLDKQFGISASKGGSMAGIVGDLVGGNPLGAAINMTKEGVKMSRSYSDDAAMTELIKLFAKKSAEQQGKK